MVNKLQFWVLLVGLASYVAKFFYPEFPLDETQILAGVLFLLGTIGVFPQVRAALPAGSILNSLAFWTLVAGIAGFVIRYFQPEFPYSNAVILTVIVFVLSQFDINPQVQRRLIE